MLTEIEGKFYDVKYCEPDELLDMICNCLLDVMLSETDISPDCVVIPTTLAFGYSEEGGLAFAIGQFFIICDNNPPEKQKMVEMIREAYEMMVLSIAQMPVRIGQIRETTPEGGKGFNFEVEINSLQ